MQLLPFYSRYFANFARSRLRCYPGPRRDQNAPRKQRERQLRYREISSDPVLFPESVLLGTAGRKHFRNPGELLSRLAKGQATRLLGLIDRFPIMEGHRPHRPLC
jgi:hypothetical protein